MGYTPLCLYKGDSTTIPGKMILSKKTSHAPCFPVDFGVGARVQVPPPSVSPATGFLPWIPARSSTTKHLLHQFLASM